MPRIFLLVCLALLFQGCSSWGPGRNYATGRYSPTWEVDDIGDGVFPNYGRAGERADGYRFGVGMKRKYLASGTEFWVEAGRENRHVGKLEIGAEVPLGK